MDQFTHVWSFNSYVKLEEGQTSLPILCILLISLHRGKASLMGRGRTLESHCLLGHLLLQTPRISWLPSNQTAQVFVCAIRFPLPIWSATLLYPLLCSHLPMELLIVVENKNLHHYLDCIQNIKVNISFSFRSRNHAKFDTLYR